MTAPQIESRLTIANIITFVSLIVGRTFAISEMRSGISEAASANTRLMEHIALVPGGATVDGGIPRFPGDMRGDAGLPEAGDKLGGVIPFIRAQGQTSGRPG